MHAARALWITMIRWPTLSGFPLFDWVQCFFLCFLETKCKNVLISFLVLRILSLFFHSSLLHFWKKMLFWLVRGFGSLPIIFISVEAYFFYTHTIVIFSFSSKCWNKTSMSFVFMPYKSSMSSIFMLIRLQCLLFYGLWDFNVFRLLHFQRLQCLLSFTLSKTSMSSIFYTFKEFNVFYLLHNH